MSVLTSILGRWNITTSGWSGCLDVSSVNRQGNLAGTLTITANDQGSATGETATAISGYWNEGAQEIWFVRDMRNIHPSDALPFQIYTAYGYRNHLTDSHETLAGFFEAFVSAEK